MKFITKVKRLSSQATNQQPSTAKSKKKKKLARKSRKRNIFKQKPNL